MSLKGAEFTGAALNIDPAQQQQCDIGSAPIYSATYVLNFRVQFTNKSTGFRRYLYYFVKFLIAAGQMDTAHSMAGYGSIPLNF